MNKNHMLTAKEAKEKANEVYKNIIANELTIIARYINEAIDAGKMSCTLDKSVNIEVKQKLESLGYKVVTSDSQYDESYTDINWRDA